MELIVEKKYEAYHMNKMVKSAALLFCGLCILKKNGRLMTHHSGLIHTLEVWICIRIEECRHFRPHHHNI